MKRLSGNKRGIPMILAALAAFALLAAAFSPALAATQPIRVAADAGWVETPISVEAGDSVTIKTEGIAITAPIRWYSIDSLSGPAGQTWNLGCGEYEGAPEPCALDDARYGALVGKVGENGSPFLIGDSTSFEAPADGFLWLAVNDNLIYYDDNEGGFTVLFR